MLVTGVESGAISSFPRPHIGGVRAGSRGCDIRDGIGIRLSRKAPDVSLEDGGIRRRIDFIDTPVVGLTEFEKPLRVVRGRGLAPADQHVPRIGGIGIIDIVKIVAEVHVVRLGERARSPAQCRIARYVNGAVFRNGVRSRKYFFESWWDIVAFVPSCAIYPEITRCITYVECDGRRIHVLSKNGSCYAKFCPFFSHGEGLRTISRPWVLSQFRLEIDIQCTFLAFEKSRKSVILAFFKNMAIVLQT
ncbi:hypothetical protein ES703_78964 [subsurface metagenome]